MQVSTIAVVRSIPTDIIWKCFKKEGEKERRREGERERKREGEKERREGEREIGREVDQDTSINS